ncbi:MAG TPA: hypothetical protein VN934_02745 [Candidatus Tumulicola sp.]|nr:hypothetical protein [Candidatus Tumulicola sp.]
MASTIRVLCIIVVIIGLAGCKGSPNIALPPPPAPRAFVTNSHTPLSVTFCICGCTIGCIVVCSNCCGGLAKHRHPLARRHALGHPHHGVHMTALRIPMTLAVNLLNVYSTPLNPSGAPTFMLGRPSGLLGRPGGIAFDSAGNMYVIDFNNNGSGVFGTIFVYHPPITATSVAAFSFTVPNARNAFAIAFDSQGRLWATDELRERIVRFNPPFNACSTPSLTWCGCAACIRPTGLAFDRSGALYVGDGISDNVLVWRSCQINGTSCVPINPPAPNASVCVFPCTCGFGCCSTPTGITFDTSQRMFVSYKENGIVSVVTPPFGTSGTGPKFQFTAPNHLVGGAFAVIDQNNNLFAPFVSDTGANRGGIAVYIPPYSSSSAPIFVLTTSIDNPYGIAFGR